MSLITIATGTCTGGTGPDLSNYRALCYAPLEHGEGIRFSRNGKLIDGIATSPVAHTAVASIDNAATDLGVSFGEFLDALRFLRDNKIV